MVREVIHDGHAGGGADHLQATLKKIFAVILFILATRMLWSLF